LWCGDRPQFCLELQASGRLSQAIKARAAGPGSASLRCTACMRRTWLRAGAPSTRIFTSVPTLACRSSTPDLTVHSAPTSQRKAAGKSAEVRFGDTAFRLEFKNEHLPTRAAGACSWQAACALDRRWNSCPQNGLDRTSRRSRSCRTRIGTAGTAVKEFAFNTSRRHSAVQIGQTTDSLHFILR
jgi:hypothetical protein